MKKRFLIAAVAAMLLGVFNAQASPVDDTSYNVRFHFTKKVTNINVGGYSKIIIVPDKEEYLHPVDYPFRYPAEKIGVSISGKNQERLKIESPAGIGTLMVHIIMEGVLTLTTNDFAQVTVGCDGSDIQGLNISTNDYSQVTFQGLKEFNRISIWANDFSRVSMPLGDQADTLQALNMYIYSSDHANVVCNVPCVVKKTNLTAKDFSNIHMDYCKGDVLNTKQETHSTAKVAKFNVVNTEFSYTGGYAGPDDDSNIEVDDPEFSKGLTDQERLDRRLEKYRTRTSDRKHRKSNEFNIRFLWGFHNWGDGHFNGLSGTVGGEALNTTFSSYQLEAMYYPNAGKNFRIGLGLGYESDVYKFANNYVQIATDGMGLNYFQVATPDDDMRTRLVARYVTLPITMQWHHGDFMLGLSAIPGLTVGDKYKVTYGKGSSKDINERSNLLNPYKFDARFTIGWQNLYAFLQIPVLPVNEGMASDLYPVKLGFAINLGD